MTLRELTYLVALADYGHFGRAADACHVSQPTLSTQLKKLEDFLGVTLFERTNKSVQVTAIGEQIVARARRLLGDADQIIQVAKRQTAPLTGPLNIGVIPTLSPYMLPWLLPNLKQAYPELQPVVVEDLTDNLIALLHQHKLDVAALALPIDDPGLAEIPLFDEPFWVACPPDHPLARAAAISLKALRAEQILYLADGHCLRDQALAICKIPPAENDNGADFRAASLETLRQMVAAGFGFTLLPALAAARDQGPNAEVVARPFAGAASRRIGLVYRTSFPKPDDLARLAEVVVDHLPPSVTPVAND
jgi:LysR family hydrogen peroxide-inducible transcriptional activator